METANATSTAKKKPHSLPWLDLLVREPFYLLHFLAFFSYFAARSSASEILSTPELHAWLLRREIQAVLAFLLFAVVKAAKTESQEEYIADVIFCAKIFLCALSLLIDLSLAFCYLIAFLVLFVLAQQPPCSKLGESFKLTPLQLEALLAEPGTSRYWLVEFRNQFSSRCIGVSRCLPELSVTYSNKIISFGIIDLGHFPGCADKFGISLEDSTIRGQQLPIYILFDRAVEVARFPRLGHAKPTPTITKSVLCRHFSLDHRLVEYIASD